jgi:hypothetical protein
MKAANIKSLLNGKSVTMAQIQYTTNVKTAAAHKNIVIQKNTNANVQLFSNIKYANVYMNAVKKSANRIGDNDKEAVESFEQTDTYYEHEDCYSIVKHRKTGKEYLYCIYNNATSEYLIDGKEVTKKDVAQYLTPSEAKKLLEDNSFVYNKANDVVHSVIVRTIGLENIKKISACGSVIEE